MLLPLSWLKEYVPVKLPLDKFCLRLSEVGVGIEAIHKKEDDTILELEITPNRPDLLSIVGVAREVAAMQSANQTVSIKMPKITPLAKRKKELPLIIKNNFSLSSRISAIVIDNITIKQSPMWLSDRLIKLESRPINNIVDITNYVMFELGNPIHAFDYDKIRGHTMIIHESLGGEKFTTVDGLSYFLPKNAIVISDKERIIDLAGIKGGQNSGITEETKRIVLTVAVDNPLHIRRASAVLKLISEASKIFERGVDKGATVAVLTRTANLVTKLAGGKIASEIFDLKKEKFTPWELSFSLDKLGKMLGVDINTKKVIKILTALNLSPKKNGKIIKTIIPTYRNDLHIEEDLIEEVARMYGYNKFLKTLPKGETPTTPIPYQKNTKVETSIKQLMRLLGFSQVNTYSLVSREDLALVGENPQKAIEVANPVSKEFAFLRPSLLINLLKAISANKKFFENIALFELGRLYQRDNKNYSEINSLSAVLFPADYFAIKGIVEALFEALNLSVSFLPTSASFLYHKTKTAGIFVGKEKVGVVGETNSQILRTLNLKNSIGCFELDFDKLQILIPKT
ncbi:phenylalanine--tRNA ligase subunit beta, partial [Candidatus Microgenomates bacterium]|nr:phenylalanine--tRNA ligase subunit beta [Candidatus Microgenomates bacterium]